MKLIPDHTGRFPERPHYEIEELEDECERIITSFLERRHGQIVIPVPTEALKVLIEGEAAKLLHADLSHEGEEVHGITEFFPGCKLWVSIARELSAQPWRAHRECTTLAHEYGHVHWHTPLYDRYCRPGERHKCARGQLLPRSGQRDWMEWQAGYISGALLMPRSRIKLAGRGFPAGACGETSASGGIRRWADSHWAGERAIRRVARSGRSVAAAARPFEPLSSGLVWGA